MNNTPVLRSTIAFCALTSVLAVGLGRAAVNAAAPHARVMAATATPDKKTNVLLPQPKSGFPPGIAPESARVDIVRPTFSNPGAITNPLLPYTKIDQIIQTGQKEGLPHRTELTLLPGTKSIKWLGEETKVRALQFVAYLDGRILETAIDYVAQADDGAVWYFGEDVNNYADGKIADNGGSWRAGKDVPPAMIMPANPQIGNVYRVENLPGIVFEEVMVKAISQTLEGPRGLVQGVLFVQQIGLDGFPVIKAFAPGYGEFLAHSEDAAVALPTDSIKGTAPAELKALLSGATTMLGTVETTDWKVLTDTLKSMTGAIEAFHASAASNQFPLLNTPLDRAFAALTEAVNVQSLEDVHGTAFDVAIAVLDLEMPYRTPVESDLARFALWNQRIGIDSAEDSPDNVLGDVAVLELIWSRVGHTIDASKGKGIVAQLEKLRAAANKEEMTDAANASAGLIKRLAELGILVN